MITTTITCQCDKCGKVMNGKEEFIEFEASRMLPPDYDCSCDADIREWDLCLECYKLFKEFMANKGEAR